MRFEKRILRKLKCLGVFAYFLLLPSFAAQAAVFFVNSPSDVMDGSPGNGICETAAGNGICTLRAAIMEANALTGADHIYLPSLPSPNTYILALAAGQTCACRLRRRRQDRHSGLSRWGLVCYSFFGRSNDRDRMGRSASRCAGASRL